MPLRFGQPMRGPNTPFGSATLAQSQRLAAGTLFTSDPVDVTREDTKTFGFRASKHGSWRIQVMLAGGQFFNYAEGTFPGGPGSITVRSFREAVQQAQVQVSLTTTGSFSAFYGGFAPRMR